MTPIIEILRRETSLKGTFGILSIQKEIHGFTLEPPKRWNFPNISCIPTGQYEIQRHNSPAFGETFQVLNVPQREFILFHAGNWVIDTEGCIIMGSSIGKLKGDRAVLNSGLTFREFMAKMQNYNFGHLTIKENF